MSDTTLPFRKMNGLGNEFVVLDGRARALRLEADAIRHLGSADSIGFDQIITIEPTTHGDAFMRIHNRDGGEVDACGNATRCIGWLVMDENGADHAIIETNAGLLHTYDAGAPYMITVDMGQPRFGWQDIPLAEPFHDTRAIELQIGPIDDPLLHSPSAVNVGNPHVIFWVDELDQYDLNGIGPLLENHPIFPERANISLARITSRAAMTVKTWERGVGITAACGTAACAAGVAAMRKKLVDRKVTVTLPGGPLVIEWRDDGHVWMTGPVEDEFTGEIDTGTLDWRRTGSEAAQ
jgi:diaminopimelate epimerase